MDRFEKGFLSGLLAGLPMNAWNFFSYYVLHFTSLRLIDWTGIILYGFSPQDFLQGAFALLIHLIFVGIMGTGFAFLVIHGKPRNYLLKGFAYAFALGFSFYAISGLFQKPYLSIFPFYTVVNSFISDAVWGFFLALILRWLDRIPQSN